MVFARPGELRAAKWADINLDYAEWKYTVSKTKTDHTVPDALGTAYNRTKFLDDRRKMGMGIDETGHDNRVAPINCFRYGFRMQNKLRFCRGRKP